MAVRDVALSLYEEQERIVRAAVQAAASLFNLLDPAAFTASWVRDKIGDRLFLTVARAQELAAMAADVYTGSILSEAGVPPAPEAAVLPRSLAGIASDGRPLEGLLLSPLITASIAVAGGATPTLAKARGVSSLARIVDTQVSDAGRTATSLGIVTRPKVGYVRLVNPGACDRCVILAGRFYRWSDGFLRHPMCHCRNIPELEEVEGLRPDNDPMTHFNSLSEAEQNRQFTPAGAQAIRDGADIFRVVNARRKKLGMHPSGLLTTTEATTKRGGLGLKPGQARLMPEAIYKIAKNREDALRLLATYGYIRP